MKKVKFKLTPQVHKQIVEAAKQLPPLVKVDSNGKPLYRKLNTYKGATMKINGSYTKTTQHELQPVFINHEVELIQAYQQYGDKGITSYVELVHEVNNNTKKVEPTEVK